MINNENNYLKDPNSTFRTQEELSDISFPDEWYKGIMEFSAEDPDPEGTLMIAWIGGKSAQVADTLSDKQVVNF